MRREESKRWFQKTDWHMFWLALVTTWILYSQLWQMRVDTRPWIQFKPDQIPMPQVDNGPWTFTRSGVVFPEVSVDGVAKSLEALENKQSVDRPITNAEYQSLMKGEAYLAISGIAYYKDVYNTKHWTTFCGWHSFAAVKLAANACVANNSVDDNLW